MRPIVSGIGYRAAARYRSNPTKGNCNCNCNWGTCIAPPTRKPRAHHRVNLYLGARRQNETKKFSDYDETSPSIAAGKGKVNMDFTAPCHDDTSKALRYGTRSQGNSISVLPVHPVHICWLILSASFSQQW